MDQTNKNIIDQHIHSRASDGFFSPSNLVVMMKELEVDGALVDHDTVKGIRDALKKSREIQHTILTGVELSTYNGKTIHILGYVIDEEHIDDLENELNESQQKRTEKTKLMVQKAHDKGLWENINFEDIEKENEYSAYISRIHVATALFRGGYHSSVLESLDAVNREGLYELPEFKSPANGIDMLKKYFKEISLAHLTTLNMDDFEEERFVRELKENGLTAIEAISSKYNDEQIIKYLNIAKKYELKITVGSDFHWEESTPKARIGIDLNATLTNDILENIGMKKEEIYGLIVSSG